MEKKKRVYDPAKYKEHADRYKKARDKYVASGKKPVYKHIFVDVKPEWYEALKTYLDTIGMKTTAFIREACEEKAKRDGGYTGFDELNKK